LRWKGTRRGTIKPRHGACAFVGQRCQGPSSGETPSLAWTEQRGAGALRARLAACSASDSHRMRYDEVAERLERVTGPPVRSDQTIEPLGVTKAVEVSRQWQSESQAETAAPPSPAVTPQVDW
jgi:hypothetical protein